MIKLLNILLLLLFIALGVFVSLNWQAIVTPIPLSLLFADAEAPLGLILLAVAGVLTLLFLMFVVYMQSSILMSRKRLTKDLNEQRELANEAEASRFTELRTYLETELHQINNQSNEIHQKLDTRLSEIEAKISISQV